MSRTFTEDQRKHFDFLQNIITRMNSNSFMIKGWAITIVSALLAWAASAKNEALVIVSVVPIVLFWLLDAQFLQTERKYRSFYEAAIADNSPIAPYDLNINKLLIYNNPYNQFWKVVFSKSMKLFYGLLAIVCIIPAVFIYCNKSTPTEPLKIEGKINVEIPKPINVKSVK